MKRIVVVLLLALCISTTAQEQLNLGIVPTPQMVEMHHSSPCHPKKIWKKKVGALPVDANMDQAYQLVIEPKGIILRYTSEDGRRYGELTLQQMRSIYGNDLPCCTITDWPAYRYRGWMDDQSRGPVPHAAYRKKQWETLHALKFNFCNYYTEHTLYQEEFPDLAPAYLADCKPHPDEVINLQLFAHAEKTLRVPFYQHLMDSRANFNPSVEETYSFLEKRIAAAYHRIPTSPFFIINCDETEQLGTGRAKKLVDSLGADQVYVDFINRCYEMINTYHWDQWEGTDEVDDTVAPDAPRIVMWGDIVAKNPAMMKQLPKDMTYIMWAYEPLDSYDHLIKPFKDNGTPFWVAPSLSHSSNMIPNPYRYMKNIANLARDGWRNGAEGLMNTCWDDNGEALFDNCWHGLFWSAEMAWNPIKTDDPEEFKRREAQFNENFERLFYGSNSTNMPISPTQTVTPTYTSQLYSLGALESDPDIADWYTSAALLEPLLNFNPDNVSDAVSDRCDKVIYKVMELDKLVDSTANPHAHYALMRIRQMVFKAALRKLVYHSLHGDDPDMPFRLKMMRSQYMTFLVDLKNEYLHLWDQENGDYERYIILNRYNDLAREVLELDRHVFMEVLPSGDQPTPMVQLRTIPPNKKTIYYTLDGSEPTSASTQYEGPFPLERSATIKAICYNKYGEGVVSEQYLLSHKAMGAKITLNTQYSTYKAIYSGGGESALVDGQLGSNTTYADGHWQGYWGDSIDAVIDFGEPRTIHEVSMRFMQNTFDWILAPKEIKVYTSNDGKEWRLFKQQQFDMEPRETGMRLRNYSIDMMDASKDMPKIVLGYPNVRYLRIVVPNPGPLPSWHPAPGQPSYLFTDEIILR